MRWILALALMCGGIVAGCSSDNDRHDRDRRDYDATPMSGAGDAQDEKYNQEDPVCHMRVNPRSAAYKENYGGKTWYFDNEECWKKFQENPHAYLPGGDDRPTEREVR
jgi:YHS domain-containing protein